MRVIFCRSKSISSWLVRVFSWSTWSHVVLVTPSGSCIEARWPRVREVAMADILEDNDVVVTSDLPCAHPDLAASWARSQVGKRYDLMAVLGVALHRDWRDDHEWFCSELVAEAFEEGGSPLFRPETIQRVTPQMIWELPSA